MINKIHNIQFLLVSTIMCGFIFGLICEEFGWNIWLGRIGFGLFTFTCVLPITIYRLKEIKKIKEEK